MRKTNRHNNCVNLLKFEIYEFLDLEMYHWNIYSQNWKQNSEKICGNIK